MKLISLKLSNFQGIKELTVDFAGKDTAIFGDNGTGKTTVYNAITWLLFDRPSTGAKGWTPKTRGADGEAHNLENHAEAVFLTDDGVQVRLGKTLREVYKKKRGSVTAEYSGNTIDYFLDGVIQKEKEYTAALTGYFGDPETMKMLTMPDYFPETMDWKKRRELLLEICGDVTDQQVIDSTEELADLPGYLRKPGTANQFYSVEDYGKIAKATKADINRQLQAIPDRIDEAKRAIPQTVPNKEALQQELAAAEDRTARVREEIAAIRAGGDATAKSELAAAQADLAAAEAGYNRKIAEAASGKYDRLAAIDAEVRAAERREDDAKNDAAVKRRAADRMIRLRESILQEYNEAAAVRWDDAQETCPTCGRRLPEDRIEEMREEFNERRSEKLRAINERGRAEASKDMIAKLQAEAEELDEQAGQAAHEAQEARERRTEAERSFAQDPEFCQTKEYAAGMERIKKLAAAVEDVESGKAAKLAAVDDRLQECLGTEHNIRGQLIQAEAQEKQLKRVADLEAQEKQLATEFENTERGVYLCELFTKTKVSLLTSRINAKFRSVSFQLFIEQVNGGLNECCEVLVPCDGAMVPYTTANNAARVNAGLEIIDTVAGHFGQQMPVIIDNAESVTKLIDTDTQVIRLVVSEADKTMRVEVAE